MFLPGREGIRSHSQPAWRRRSGPATRERSRLTYGLGFLRELPRTPRLRGLTDQTVVKYRKPTKR